MAKTPRAYVHSLAPNVKNPPPDEMHFMIAHRGTSALVEQWHTAHCGRTVDVQGRRYQIERVHLDDLRRVIAVSKYVG